MTALVCPSAGVLELQRALDKVVSDAARFGVSAPAELHGHALVQGKDDWTPMAQMVRARIGIYEATLGAINAVEGVQLLQCGVDRGRLNARYVRPWHPHRVTLGNILQRLDDCARLLGEPVLTIADEVGEHDVHRAHVWSYQHVGTASHFHDKLTWIADTLHFAPSNRSRLLQAADMVSYLHFRWRRTAIADPRATKVNDDLWARIEPLVRLRHFWTP
jgi:hypothetical protein